MISHVVTRQDTRWLGSRSTIVALLCSMTFLCSVVFMSGVACADDDTIHRDDQGNYSITNNRDITYSDPLEGSGTLKKSGSGILILTGQDTRTGDTTIDTGQIYYGDGSAKGTNTDQTVTHSQKIGLENKGILKIFHSDDVKLESDLSGKGSFVQAGTGTTTLTGTINLDDSSVAGTPFPQDDKVIIPSATFLVDGGTMVVTGQSGLKENDQELTSATGGKITVSTNGYIVVGRERNTEADLVIQGGGGVLGRAVESKDGSNVISSSILIGFSQGSKGAVTVKDATSSLVANGAQGIIVVGNAGSGNLTVSDGGGVRANGIILANTQGSSGTVLLTGEGASMVAGNPFDGNPAPNGIPSDGSGHYPTNSNSGVYVNGGGNGTVTVENGAKLTVNGRITFGNGQGDGKGVFNLNKGGVLQIGDVRYIDPGDGQVKLLNGITGTFDVPSARQQSYQFNLAGGMMETQGGRLTTNANMTLVDDTTSTIDTNGGHVTLSGTLSGGGNLVQQGGAYSVDSSTETYRNLMVLNGTNTYTGETTVKEGRLRLGSGGSTGSLDGTSAIHLASSDSSLEVNRNNRATVAAPIDGAGSVYQTGSGVTVLQGDNSYTGTTTVTNGTLQIDGNQSAATGETMVQKGATLRGNGQIGGDVTVTGGTLAVGGGGNTPMGTLTINGDLSFKADGQSPAAYSVRLDDNQTADLVKVGKTATFEDGTKLVVSPKGGMHFGDAYRYHIMETGSGIKANETALNDNLETSSRYLKARAEMDDADKNLYLILARKEGVSYAVGNGMTRNGNAVGRALDNVTSSSLMWDAPYMDDGSTDGQGNPSAAALAQRQRAYDALSGEINASLRTALFQDSYYIRQAVLGRMAATDCDGLVSGYETATPTQPHTYLLTSERCTSALNAVWGQSYGGMGRNEGNSNAASLHHNTAGFIVGVDRAIDDHWRVGAVLGYDHTGFSINRGRDSSGKSDNVTLGAYAGAHWGNVRLRTGVDYTWNVVSTTRRVNYILYGGGTTENRYQRLNNGYTGGVAQTYAELAYRYRLDDMTRIEPFASAAYMVQYNGTSTEKGGPAALRVYSSATGITLLSAGVRASTKFMAGDVVFQPYGAVAYQHAFGNLMPTIHQRFAMDRASMMDIAGAPLSDDVALLDFGLRAWLSDLMDITLSYIGQYGNHSHENGGQANLRIRF